MHVSLDVVHQRAHPQKKRLRTEAERKQQEIERRQAALRRFSSLSAQLLVPLCPLFSLPGLTEKWYVVKDASGAIVEARPDPPLIVAAGALTLALAIFANIAILFRLIDTHPRFFSLGTIAFLTAHVVVNLVALIIFGVEHAHPDGYVLSTAFWLTAASACVAAASVALLIFDGTLTGWYSRGGTGVSGQQRSLVLTWDFFVFLILIGSVAYRYLIIGATYLDTIYFCVQSALTVGFGDVTLNTTGAIVFSVFWNVFGILTFALLVTFTRATALEAVQEQYKSQERLILERLRRHVPATASPSPGIGSLVISIVSFGLIRSRPRQEAEQEVADAEEEEESVAPGSGAAEHERYEKAIEELRADRGAQGREEQRVPLAEQLATSLVFFLTFWFVGAAVFGRLEGWTYGIAFYFVFVMASSIGYGDYAPQTQAGRAFFCVWAILGAGILTVLFSVIADAYTSRFKETFQRSFLTRAFIKVFQPQHAKELQHADIDVLPQAEKDGGSGSSLSLPRAETGKTRDSDGTVIPAREDDDRHDHHERAVLSLLRDVRRHLDHLIVSDDDVKDEHVDRVARRVMDREQFSRENREHVENDRSMKEFLYLRHLRDKLAQVERVASQRVHGGDHHSDPCEKCRRHREQEAAQSSDQKMETKDA
ncbi:hypothetical protein C6P46_003518 [Rhodotorula mucilaginosa]|uniref:Potassium channel domain-containing protein n=1 Tax=Rhodotorula mucilaginosa TaxID=5537 RepID=A0A9P6W1L0_RHOMI|nr:hypothetical protein C6P46_003518 [Rhodotorula mucilaginosa]TKA58104.1 hypothetical protein B0A53_00506 [Rhodotorula sp. CCFEE 5036]